ncbi:MAG: AarF/ABC1/UbiB kinase family protein [Bacteroidota bacterium]
MAFNQNIKDFNRVVEIIQVLGKYRLEEVIFIFQLRSMVPKERKIRWGKGEGRFNKYTTWERIRMAFEELGPAFVKLGQVLSNRHDILPIELVNEFEKLQSSVAPFPSEKAKNIVESEAGKSISELFISFEVHPLASASIGQVHRATLKSGEQVVVKVQRPGIQRMIERDLSVLKRSARLAQNTLEKNFGITNAMDFILEFEKTMQKELRYSIEARNIQQFRDFYKDYVNFYIPNVFKALSSDKVLVTEYMRGCKITDVDTMRSWGLQPEKIAEQGMDIYMTQMFEYGYFHADPHPGNIIIQQDGTIGLIDFGMVGKLMKNDKYAFAEVLIAMANQDAASMGRNLRQLATHDEITNRKAYELDLNEIIEEYSTLNVSEINIAELAMALQQIIYKYKMQVPGSLFLLLRAMAILEGIGKTIHPTFNTYEYIKPYGKKLLKEKFSKENITNELLFRLNQFDYFLRNFPIDVQEITRNIRKGKLNVKIDHHGYEPVTDKLNRGLNRMMLTMIIVGLLLASAIVMTVPRGKTAATESGMPYLSIGGFILAAFLSMLLWWSSWRSTK